MSRIQTETQDIRTCLLGIIGETKAKTYFSYYGIFKDDVMFGLYKNGKFYLRLAEEDIQTALKYIGVDVLADRTIVQSRKYYYLPQCIFTKVLEVKTWIENSIKEIKENKSISYYSKKQQIRFLPNMSFAFERLLKKIEITTIEQLIEKGEVAVFVELIKIGIDVNENSLFKLHGAINRQLVYTISAQKQTELLAEANEALYAAGLRRMFKI